MLAGITLLNPAENTDTRYDPCNSHHGFNSGHFWKSIRNTDIVAFNI